MGATTFETIGRGTTAKEAFETTRNRALYDHGHSGYSGTIAEKTYCTIIPAPPGADRAAILAHARDLIDKGDPRVDDKWGPAGCIKLAEGEWLFFGWASC